MRPFLKWAGGKHKLAPLITPHLRGGRRLVEPFMGSCALFLASDFEEALLCDINADLVSLYTILRDEGQDFIDDVRGQLFDGTRNTEAAFYALREEFNDPATDARRRAMIFVYLNRHAFNGLCRYSAKGAFNVPFGSYKSVHFPGAEMAAFAQRTRSVEFRCQSFEDTFSQVRAGDVVYADPPYFPLSPSASFTAYAASGFSLADQIRLAELARDAARAGILVAISNHDTDEVIALYEGLGADCSVRFQVQRNVSGSGDSRKKVGEVLALFRPA